MKKSWKTTTAAIIGVATIALTQVQAAFDGNPETVANWALITPSIVACIGLFFAKDNTKEA